MKTTNRYQVNPRKINSMEDLRLEKQRLRFEIMKTEENIHQGYRDILHSLTLKNIAATLINDLPTSSSVLSKAFSYGKAIMEKRKKKKQEKMELKQSS